MTDRSTLQPATSSWKTIAALGGTFVLGLIVGALAVGTLVYQRVDTLRSLRTESGFVTRFTEIIDPTGPDQRQTIEPILQDTGREVERTFLQSRDSLAAEVDRMRSRLDPHLTAEQRRRLERAIHRLRSRVLRRTEDRESTSSSAPTSTGPDSRAVNTDS